MKKTRVTKSDIEKILNDKLTMEYWELELGIGLQYEYYSGTGKFSAPYPKIGKELWTSFKYELYELLCDKESKEPKEWLNDLITGDIRNLIVGISTAVTAKYDVTLGIAVPLSALVIKTGVLDYCDKRPRKKPKRTVTQILTSKKGKNKKKG